MTTRKPKIRKPVSLPPEWERHRKISSAEAAAIKGISEDSFKRHYPHLIHKLSPRRNGVTLGDVIDDPKAA
jgi:hypothetical protein